MYNINLAPLLTYNLNPNYMYLDMWILKILSGIRLYVGKFENTKKSNINRR